MTGEKDSPYGAKVYVLYGYWDTLEERDAAVIKASLGPGPVMDELDRIAQDKAGAYVELYGDLQEERGERYYEATDPGCRYARFYIKETAVEWGDDLGSAGLDRRGGEERRV